MALNRVNVVTKHVLAPDATGAKSSGGESMYKSGKYFSVLPEQEHLIIFPEDGPLSEKACPLMTCSQLLSQAAANFPTKVALAAERPVPNPLSQGVAPSLPWEAWTKWTWKQYYEDSRRAAKGFIHLGVEHFGSVSIFGFNAPEWMLSAYGAVFCGAKYVGLYLTDTADQVQYKVAHSNSAVIVVDAQKEFDAVQGKLEEMPCLKAIVLWGASANGDLKRGDGSVCRVLTWTDLIKLGDEKSNDQELETRLKNQRAGHAMGIIYTSGTTGNPKAVMIHHDALCAQGAMSSLPELGLHPCFADGGARILSYLPLSHIAGSLIDIFNPVYFAGRNKLPSTVYFSRPYDLKEMTLAARLQFVRPTLLMAVPRVYEKMQARMMAVGASITGLKKTIATWAKGKGLEAAKAMQVGGSGHKPMLYGLADKVVLSKAREALGLDKCQAFITGAAPISVETLEYFGQLGMMLQNVYGMSESSGLTTISTPARNKFGTVGHALTGIEVKCFKVGTDGQNVEVPRCKPGLKSVPEDEQGELCYRGRHIMMGYMANVAFGPEHIKDIEDKNTATIDEWGWLHSGDKGCIDIHGMVKITGRYKELIIGAGGENIAPVPVEENIKLLCPALSNVMMVGDNRKYNVVLVTLHAEGATGEFPGGDDLTAVAQQVSPGIRTISQAMNDPVWRSYIQSAIDSTNNDPHVCQNNQWKVQKFAIVPRDFSIQTGELTATLKLKRSVAQEIWGDVIESLYAER